MTSVQAYFDKQEPEMQAVALALRDAIEREGRGLSVGLAWGFPCWKGNERVFSIIAHSAYCNLQLWYGAELAARFPDRIEGTGKALRHVKIRSLEDVDGEVHNIIAAAIELDATSPKAVR